MTALLRQLPEGRVVAVVHMEPPWGLWWTSCSGWGGGSVGRARW